MTHRAVLLGRSLVKAMMQLLNSSISGAGPNPRVILLLLLTIIIVLLACIVVNVKENIQRLSLLEHLFVRPVKHLIIYPGLIIKVKV